MNYVAKIKHFILNSKLKFFDQPFYRITRVLCKYVYTYVLKHAHILLYSFVCSFCWYSFLFLL